MKVLTVKQPWASLIAHGIKDIENRTWKTNFRGRVLIHAGKALCRKSIFETLNFEQYSAFREKVGFSGLDFIEPKGAIIGSEYFTYIGTFQMHGEQLVFHAFYEKN